jgi:hypothetical protein
LHANNIGPQRNLARAIVWTLSRSCWESAERAIRVASAICRRYLRFRPRILLLPRCRKADCCSDSLTKSDPLRAAQNKRNKQ